MDNKNNSAEVHENLKNSNMMNNTRSLEKGEKCNVANSFRNENNGTVNQYNNIVHNNYYIYEGKKIDVVEVEKPLVKKPTWLENIRQNFFDAGQRVLFNWIWRTIIDQDWILMYVSERYFSGNNGPETMLFISILTVVFYLVKCLVK